MKNRLTISIPEAIIYQYINNKRYGHSGLPIKSPPKYEKIVRELETLIQSRELAIGEKLPSVVKLCEKYGVSTITAHQSIRELKNKGLVKCGRGAQGTTVIDTQPPETNEPDTFACLLRPFTPDYSRQYGEHYMGPSIIVQTILDTISENNCRSIFHSVKEDNYEKKMLNLVRKDWISGVILDQQTPPSTVKKLPEVSRKPVVASHTFCNAVNSEYRAFRGKSDEVIRQIVKSGGFVGICALAGFLGRSGDINALLDHIDHIAGNFGPDYASIGTDNGFIVGPPPPLPKDKKIKFRTSFDIYWPESQKKMDVTPQMQDSLAWTNWPLFTVGLVQRGFSGNDIRKIIGGNIMRVIKKTLHEANGEI